jgi:hypothetical protein
LVLLSTLPTSKTNDQDSSAQVPSYERYAVIVNNSLFARATTTKVMDFFTSCPPYLYLPQSGANWLKLSA